MEIVILLVGFSIGLVLLVKGADEMVSSAVQIALKFKLPSSIIGATFALKVEMTQMPQMVAIFNGFGGSASALVAAAEFLKTGDATTYGIAARSLIKKSAARLKASAATSI